MKLEYGDAFEKRCAGWLREKLPWYEKVWQEFIGHRGDGWPLVLQGLNSHEEGKRKKFYQAHYTFAVNCFFLEQLVKNSDEKIGSVKDFDSFMDIHKDLILFISLIGNIRDMFKIMDDALSLKEKIFLRLQEFYYKRSHVIHGPRMPSIIEEGFFKIPIIAGENKQFGEWDDKSVWGEVEKKNFVYIQDFYNETLNELYKEINNLHPQIYEGAKNFFKNKKLIEDSDYDTQSATLSGSEILPASTYYDCYSGEVYIKHNFP
jgi:hypothetical protein